MSDREQAALPRQLHAREAYAQHLEQAHGDLLEEAPCPVCASLCAALRQANALSARNVRERGRPYGP